MRGSTVLLALAVVANAYDSADYFGSVVTSLQELDPDPLTNEMPIWPKDKVPSERPGATGPETWSCLAGGPVSSCIDKGVKNVSVPTLIPYLVKGADAAVIVAPGGAYRGLAINREGTDIAMWLNSIGVSAYVLKYRVPDRSCLPFGAAPLMDAQRAMGLVRLHAAQNGINATKVGFMGFSAGAHLTGHLNVAWQTRSYTRVDAADDQPCRPDFSIMVYPWESVSQAPVNANREQASALNVTNATPPTMIVQAEDDPVHMENALFYYYAMKQAGAPASELHIYPRGGHGYGRCTVSKPPWQEVCTWPDRGELFLQTLGVAPKRCVSWSGKPLGGGAGC